MSIFSTSFNRGSDQGLDLFRVLQQQRQFEQSHGLDEREVMLREMESRRRADEFAVGQRQAEMAALQQQQQFAASAAVDLANARMMGLDFGQPTDQFSMDGTVGGFAGQQQPGFGQTFQQADPAARKQLLDTVQISYRDQQKLQQRQREVNELGRRRDALVRSISETSEGESGNPSSARAQLQRQLDTVDAQMDALLTGVPFGAALDAIRGPQDNLPALRKSQQQASMDAIDNAIGVLTAQRPRGWLGEPMGWDAAQGDTFVGPQGEVLTKAQAMAMENSLRVQKARLAQQYAAGLMGGVPVQQPTAPSAGLAPVQTAPGLEASVAQRLRGPAQAVDPNEIARRAAELTRGRSDEEYLAVFNDLMAQYGQR